MSSMLSRHDSSAPLAIICHAKNGEQVYRYFVARVIPIYMLSGYPTNKPSAGPLEASHLSATGWHTGGLQDGCPEGPQRLASSEPTFIP